jgi:hypothetical protein
MTSDARMYSPSHTNNRDQFVLFSHQVTYRVLLDEAEPVQDYSVSVSSVLVIEPSCSI